MASFRSLLCKKHITLTSLDNLGGFFILFSMKVITNVNKWKIKTPCNELTKSLNDKLSLYGKDKFATIILESDDIKKIEGCIAAFSFNSFLGAGLNKRIDISDKVKYDKDNKLIIFETVDDAFYLQHELNHFVHFCIDKGTFIHPNLKGKQFNTYNFRYGIEENLLEGVKNWKKATEIEVAYRCLLDDINYNVPTDLALIDRHIQKANLFMYENYSESMTKEEKSKFCSLKKDEMLKYMDSWCEQISITKILPDINTKFTYGLCV